MRKNTPNNRKKKQTESNQFQEWVSMRGAYKEVLLTAICDTYGEEITEYARQLAANIYEQVVKSDNPETFKKLIAVSAVMRLMAWEVDCRLEFGREPMDADICVSLRRISKAAKIAGVMEQDVSQEDIDESRRVSAEVAKQITRLKKGARTLAELRLCGFLNDKLHMLIV